MEQKGDHRGAAISFGNTITNIPQNTWWSLYNIHAKNAITDQQYFRKWPSWPVVIYFIINFFLK